MKPQLNQLQSRLYSEPWLIKRERLHLMCRQFQAMALGEGTDKAGLFDLDEADCEREEMEGVEIAHGIALIRVDGVLGKNLDWIDRYYFGGYDIGELQAQAMELQARNDVHTVVIHYNTPGGAAAGVADVAATLRDLASTKRLISYVDDACSGGYWLAAAADEIYGGQSCMVGSISAVCAVQDWSKRYDEEGVKVEVFTDGKLKGAGIRGTSLTDAQRADIQQRIEHIGGMFKAFVSDRRPGLPDGVMEGQWFYGDTAVDLGLMDGIAPSLEEVIAMAAV